MAVPKYDEMYNALLKALQELGGSASISEMEEKVVGILRLSEEDLDEIHRRNQTKFSYRLAWTRTYLKNYGALENSSYGVWSLTPKGTKIFKVSREEVNNFVKNKFKGSVSSIEEETDEGKTPETAKGIWEDELLENIMKLSPPSFERLCQRILRESGFEKVKVVGRVGDGGIDGTGIFKLGGLLSMPVIFQCKRYRGNVVSKEIRDFRGAMSGRTDKGLFITTGNFTRDAKLEAIREGVPLIDLIDGEKLVQKMKELGLGVNIVQEEKVEINDEWFEGFEVVERGLS